MFPLLLAYTQSSGDAALDGLLDYMGSLSSLKYTTYVSSVGSSAVRYQQGWMAVSFTRPDYYKAEVDGYWGPNVRLTIKDKEAILDPRDEGQKKTTEILKGKLFEYKAIMPNGNMFSLVTYLLQGKAIKEKLLVKDKPVIDTVGVGQTRLLGFENADLGHVNLCYQRSGKAYKIIWLEYDEKPTVTKAYEDDPAYNDPPDPNHLVREDIAGFVATSSH